MGHGGGWAASPPFPPREKHRGPRFSSREVGWHKDQRLWPPSCPRPQEQPHERGALPGHHMAILHGGVSGSPQPHSPGSPGAANPEPLERFCRSLAGKQVTHFTTITDSPLCGGHPPARDPSGNTLAPTVQNFLVGRDKRETRCLPDVSLHQKGR